MKLRWIGVDSDTFLFQAYLLPKDNLRSGAVLYSSSTSTLVSHINTEKYFCFNASGKVLPIGGVKEKTLAAKRAEVKEVIFPEGNKKDWEELD